MAEIVPYIVVALFAFWRGRRRVQTELAADCEARLRMCRMWAKARIEELERDNGRLRQNAELDKYIRDFLIASAGEANHEVWQLRRQECRLRDVWRHVGAWHN